MRQFVILFGLICVVIRLSSGQKQTNQKKHTTSAVCDAPCFQPISARRSTYWRWRALWVVLDSEVAHGGNVGSHLKQRQHDPFTKNALPSKLCQLQVRPAAAGIYRQ